MFPVKLRLMIIVLLVGGVLCASAMVSTNAQPAQAPGAEQPGDLPELVALAEKDVAIKRAAVRVAKAQIAVAEAKLKILVGKAKAAQAAEQLVKDELQRFKKLYEEGALALATLRELERSYQSRAAQRGEFDEALPLGEAEVELERARREVSQAEL